jgi:hypothetical protein
VSGGDAYLRFQQKEVAELFVRQFVPILGQITFGASVILGGAGGLVSGAYFGFTVTCPA